MITAVALVVMAASPCTSVQGRVLSRAEARARVDYARALLVREHQAYQAWQAGWMVVMALGVAGQASWANFPMSRGERAALLVGTLKASVGAVAVATMPDPDPPGVWGGDVCQQLHTAQSALAELAEVQAASTTVWRHVGSVLLNLAGTVFVGMVYDDWTSAVTSGLVGVAVGQAVLHTRPDGALDSSASVTAGPGGVGLVVRF